VNFFETLCIIDRFNILIVIKTLKGEADNKRILLE